MIGKKSYYTRKLDALISKKVRARGKCDRCGGGKQMQVAHIISRNNKTLRWDLLNLLCLCPACHFWAHQDPLGFTEFVKDRNIETYEYLMYKKNYITQRSAKDLKEMWEALK